MLRFRDGRIGRPQCESIDAPEAARCVVHSARRAGTVSIEQSDPVNWMNMEQIDHEPMRASAGRMTKKRRGISIRTDGGRIVGIRRAHGRGLAQCKVDRGEGCAVSKTATVMEWQTQQEHTVARTQTHSRMEREKERARGAPMYSCAFCARLVHPSRIVCSVH